EVEAALHRAGGERGARAVHARLDAVAVRRLADLVARGHVHRVRVVAPRGQAQRAREVGGADVYGVEPRRTADRVQVREPFLGLDHGHHDDLAVRLGQVVGATVA